MTAGTNRKCDCLKGVKRPKRPQLLIIAPQSTRGGVHLCSARWTLPLPMSYARINIFNRIQDKYGHDTLRLVRRYEKLGIKLGKINCDLQFLLACKKEQLITTFARPKLSIYATNKVKLKIANIIFQTEIQNKHRERNGLKKELRKSIRTLRKSLPSIIIFESLRFRLRNVITNKSKKWSSTHERKLMNLRSCVPARNKHVVKRFSPNVVHNFSSYVLSPCEKEALSYSLDYAIPSKHHTRKLETEFENFYQQILPHTTRLIADGLPLQPIISKIGSATYNTSKYLAKLLIPLTKSTYTTESSLDFISSLKGEKVPHNYKLVDGVAMGSPLGPVLANIFMVELEKEIVPKLENSVKFWKRYVDDTICFVKENQINNVLVTLNSYHSNIQFTYEVENDNYIAFLDVKVKRMNDGSFNTSIYRKDTNTDIYMHWISFAPRAWKVGTVKSLVLRAFNICSSSQDLKYELNQLKNVFININDYPEAVVSNVINNTWRNFNIQNADTMSNEDTNEPPITPFMVLPYKGDHGNCLVKRLNKTFKQFLPANVKPRIAYQCRKLSSLFSVKDRSKDEHKHGVVYKYTCPVESCDATYIGETGRRLNERMIDHQKRDKNSPKTFSH
ncbi:uncharacterized protein LOC130648530 [Hydractinia symbiolongicarpus]|uniref:uncharacterized protein LOC130648530 n=1 Tax=Hydractinia symbiolongicarpus TaxID=13093 RepID=UPI00254AF97C|nr:uncharacterized protein LOC130648530 [Hydractinia symbiolongicarpus]